MSESLSNNERINMNTVRYRRTADVLAADIKQKIISREYPDGTRLPTETEMAAQLSVSRPTVREALRMLEADGLIVTRPGPGGGARVRRPDILTVKRTLTTLFQYERVTLQELLDARRAIEPACATIAARRASAEDVAKLRESIAEMRATSGEDNAFWMENANFHMVLVETGQNTVLRTMMRALRELVFQYTASLPLAEEEREGTLEEHTAIMKAIEARDPERAAEATLRHLLRSEERLQSAHPDVLESAGFPREQFTYEPSSKERTDGHAK